MFLFQVLCDAVLMLTACLSSFHASAADFINLLMLFGSFSDSYYYVSYGMDGGFRFYIFFILPFFHNTGV